MKVVYHCYGGTHSSVVAASIHVGRLPDDALPSASELEELPFFDKATREDMGVIHRVGSDEFGNEVFCLGRRNATADVIGALSSACKISGNPSPVFVNTIPQVNTLMRIGGYLSREAGLTRIGRRLVIKGTLRAYWSLVDLVKQVKLRLNDVRSTRVDVPDCDEPCERSPDPEDQSSPERLSPALYLGMARPRTTIYVARTHSLLPVLAAGIHSGWIKPEAWEVKLSNPPRLISGVSSSDLEWIVGRWFEFVKRGPGLIHVGPDTCAFYALKKTDVVTKAVRSWCALTGNGLIRLIDLGPLDRGPAPVLARVLAVCISGLGKNECRFDGAAKEKNRIYMSYLRAQGHGVTSSVGRVFLMMAAKGTIRGRFAALRDLVNESRQDVP